MQCYACDRDAAGQCINCRRWFCSFHGSGRCDRCRDIPGAYPSALLYRAVLGMFIVVLALAGWQLAAWPQFGPMPALSADSAGTAPSEAPTKPQASASPEPTAITAPASPTPVPTPSPTATPAQRRYIVQGGDTMSDIAQRFGITTAALIAANPNVDPSVMRIGSELIIP